MSVESPFPGEEPLPNLTKIQGERLIKKLAGKSISEIAQEEKVSRQAVFDTLNAPHVGKYAVRVYGRTMAYWNGDIGREVDMIAHAVHTLAHTMCRAKKALILNRRDPDGTVTQRIEYVPDMPTRLAAAKLYLEIVRPLNPLGEEFVYENIDHRDDTGMLWAYPESNDEDDEEEVESADEPAPKDVTPKKLEETPPIQ